MKCHLFVYAIYVYLSEDAGFIPSPECDRLLPLISLANAVSNGPSSRSFTINASLCFSLATVIRCTPFFFRMVGGGGRFVWLFSKPHLWNSADAFV